MIYQTKGILLHRLKHTNSRIILKILTRKFGLQSYLYFSSNSKKKIFEQNILQPLYLFDLQVYHKEDKLLHKIKEISSSTHFMSIPFNVYKQSITFFIAEFMLKVLQENQADEELFDFAENMIINLDSAETDIADFHLFFLYRLTEFLGILPDKNYSSARKIFDLRAGKFITGHPNHKFFLSEKLSEILYEISRSPKYEIKKLSVTKKERAELLESLTEFYNIHLGKPGNLKTPKILNQIFS